MDWTRLKRLTTPSIDVVSIATARDHLRVAHNLDDTLIDRLIDTAIAVIEGPTGAGIPLLLSRWQLTLDHLPRCIDLDLCPVASVDKITVDGVTLDPTTYVVDIDSTPARIVLCHHTTSCLKLGSVKVEFTAGYETIPADLVHAILMLVAHFYEHREAASAVDLKDVPFAVNAILARYRAY
ncbi:putative phiE125 gp8 family phage protein [Novosphingobium chloroacetimidivorans]|uniref:Putative phiE125 gp8 family phage protein n=1 Tax=Novosphingobium chloroacetimidivorans TaxID=1428314 RepID=A0A7W7NXT4_9SPHN|nr:head-tail connector protein [Novosphingobium chloroacetimidivorans]MBB4859462.1 putative phiE125 gp8 family phage protein [Novosphingobium chloroacetimidivorans]